MFGGEIDAGLVGGILRLDPNFNIIGAFDRHDAGRQARLLPRPPGRLLDGRHGRLHDPPRPVRARPAAGVHQRRAARRHPARARHRPDASTTSPRASSSSRRCRRSTTRSRCATAPSGCRPRRPPTSGWARCSSRSPPRPRRWTAVDPAERLPGRVHLADDRSPAPRRIYSIYTSQAVFNGEVTDQDLHRRQVPDHRHAQLRRQQHLDQRPPVRRPVEGLARQRHGPVPRRRPRPGPRC